VKARDPEPKPETPEPAPASDRVASDPTAPESSPPDAASALEAELVRLRSREDELLRGLAELQNVNRRRRQEAEAAIRFAAEPVIRDLLPVIDDLDRALRASPDERDPLRAGVALVRDRLTKALERAGVTPIDPRGEPFDPELHDAIAHLPTDEAAPGTVVEVAVPGYRYQDRVLRHASVVVAAERAPAGKEAP
jgi:molecular chaperone GrpE